MVQCVECNKNEVSPNYKLCLNCCNRLKKCAICATGAHYTDINPFCKQCIYDMHGACKNCGGPLTPDVERVDGIVCIDKNCEQLFL